jgi:von Willebrand factor type A domain
VLDNTGSMGSSNKMNELKKALCGQQDCGNATPSSGFISIMKTASTYDGQIRISLVPFDTTVRMPQNVQDAVNTDTPIATTMTGSGAGYCSSGVISDNAQRVSFFRFANRDKDTMASNRNAANQNVGTGCGVGRTTPATWQGCVWDRDQPGNKDATDSGIILSDVTTLHPAVNCRTNNLARLLPLTDVRTNASQLIAAMSTMQPSGNTNLTPGISWGLATLTNAAPFTEGKVPDPKLRKFMILLTDGENTENRYTTNSGAIDPRALQACTNVKAQGISIYSVRVIDGDRALLQACASNASMYYEVSSASGLTPVFEAIANEIGSIRLTN